ncbi:MAG: sulfatase-like hydrolase/transferase, partial [Gammaproteobacteria bacterium]
MSINRLLVCALLPVTLILAGPVHLYLSNRAEFSAPPGALLVHLLVLCAAAACAAYFGAGWLSRRTGARELGIALLFAVSALVWLQGNLLVFDYGPLDGRGLRWDDKQLESAAELAIWCAVLAFAAWRPAAVSRIAPAASGALLLAQVAGVVVTGAGSEPARSFKPAETMREEIHTLAPERNVIMILVDTFQTDVFESHLKREPSLASRFDGFSYFRNAIGAYPTTAASVPLMLTGRYYENEQPLQAFAYKRLTGESLPKLFYELGYQVDLMPLTRYVMSCNEQVASNCIELRRAVQSHDLRLGFDEAARLLDVALFRHLPHALKPLVYDDGNWLASDLLKHFGVDAIAEGHWLDTQFIDLFRARARVVDGPGTFKLYHLFGLHPPYRLDEQCEERPIDQTRDVDVQRRIVMAQAHCVLDYVLDFLDHLKALNVYDSSLIVVAGDHGTSGALHIGVDGAVMNAASGAGSAVDLQPAATPGSVPDGVVASSLPLLLIKPPGARGDLRASHAPVSLCDVPRTVATAMGLQAGFPCEDAFAVTEGVARERRYLYYRWDDDFWQKAYLPNMREFVVNGPVWQPASWSASD